MIYIIPIYEVLHHVCEIGALSCIQGGGRSRQHHRRRSGPVYLPVRRQPVHQAAGGRLSAGRVRRQAQQLLLGTLVIGASDTVTSQFLLPYLDRFHRQYPAIHIQIVSGRSHKVLGLLQSGKVDIAFASTPQESASLETHPCFATHSVFVASADYPCDFGHVYSLAEIAAFPLILLERKASSRLYLEKYFLQNGQRLHPEIELGARSLLVDLAAIGFGVAGVTEEFVHEELSKGRLRKLATDFEIPPRSVDLCVLRDVPLTPAAQRFADFVKDSLSQRSGAPLNWEN